MDYSDGVFKLSISKESRFMQLYLRRNVYSTLYGKGDIPIQEEYDSVDAIEAYYSDKPRDAMLMKYRINAYKKMKANLETFIQKLKDKEIHIRNADQILDDRYAVLQFFGVADSFDCDYDEEYGYITNAKKEMATFVVPSGRQFQLSVTDLVNAFELGLDSIEEIVFFLSRWGSLELSEIL